jgi:hypothetical protein
LQNNDTAGFCVAHMSFTNLYNYTGRRVAHTRSIEEATRYYRDDAHSASFLLSGLDLGIQIPLNFSARSRAIALARIDTWTKSSACARRSRRSAPSAGHYSRWLSCLIERDFGRAGALADRAVALATEHGIRVWAANGQLVQGAAALALDPDR